MINYTNLNLFLTYMEAYIHTHTHIYHETITTIKILKVLLGYFGCLPSVPLSFLHPIHRKKLRAVGEEGNRGWDDWMASLTRWIYYINGLVHNVYEWLFKQNTDILRLIHVIRYINSFFINKNEETALYFVLYIFHKLFVSSLIYTYFFYIWWL